MEARGNIWRGMARDGNARHVVVCGGLFLLFPFGNASVLFRRVVIFEAQTKYTLGDSWSGIIG